MEILHNNKYYSFERHGDVNNSTPVLILPPFAGRGGSVTDNLVKKCVEMERLVYRYELKSATNETKDLSIGGLTQIVRQCHDTILEECDTEAIDLLGTCQGGWLATIYTSMYPKEVNKLALFAAPINTKTGCGNAIEKYCDTISIPMHKLIVQMNGGIQSGASQWSAFAAQAPEFVYFGRYMNLARHIFNGDDKAVARWRKENAWYDATRDLAGVWFLDALENHFTNNALYEGTWEIYGKRIDLSKIVCPIYVMTGDDDIITSQEQALGIFDKVSSLQKEHISFEKAGHTKVFTGSKELEIFTNKFM